ncbi:30S ribosomal protein S20 [Buchnera aphidicola]|uniref:Small ribosomal subunit protein bS20 n=1 Tax=Buchnera aphidicola subsp. Cinara cedri (strain Cc) TaxID=372461 RepID=RS20_BUCCC|nr:30S ribosomal protein S20 [Buchnera aphidicola]Q057X8.1 RecName: Full=Small ribosomal subunit protein bS20; AltName: Full=30S ribosomal protein S20 [Buchnera aphidicola BCc]ABJ90571.1 30S ribosomal protein S20 [Buchnera aphidicola BCc]
MANIKSSKKHISISEKRRKYNCSKRSMIKTFMKKVLFFIKEKNRIKAIKFFYIFQSLVDRYSLKKIIHINKASRYKSVLMNNIKKI